MGATCPNTPCMLLFCRAIHCRLLNLDSFNIQYGATAKKQIELGSTVVECLSQDREVAGSSLTGVTALLGCCPFLGGGSVVVYFFVYCYSHCVSL